MKNTLKISNLKKNMICFAIRARGSRTFRLAMSTALVAGLLVTAATAIMARQLTVAAPSPEATGGGGGQGATPDILYNFMGGNDGANPFASVVIGTDGTLYGTTQQGGTMGGGTIFELKPPPWGGDWVKTVLYNFRSYSFPSARLAIGSKGEIYGTAYFGGQHYVGSVFELMPPASPGGAWMETDIYSFSYPNGDPQNPSAGVIIGEDGVLYGTTQFGGISANCTYYGCGSVYSLTPPATPGGTWTETTLYSFMGGSDGSVSLAGLVPGNHGELYGSTYSGGAGSICEAAEGGGCGTVYQLTPPSLPGGAWAENVLYSFQGGSDGGYPSAVLLQGGRLYGTAKFGGDLKSCGGYGCGAVFELSPGGPGGAWTERVLFNFKGGLYGAFPSSGYIGVLSTFSSTGVAISKAGDIYGTTADGGDSLNCPDHPGCGTVFRLFPPAGPHAKATGGVIYSFQGTDAFSPYISLVFGSDGTLYGTTPYGGTFGQGTVFALKHR